MSAPTPAPGDESPREGYYPDPSIPGYVRYWNGASWVPGTSRPAPRQTGPAAAPAAGAQAAPVEETGPIFFDEEDGPQGSLLDGPVAPAGSGETAADHGDAASVWQADAARQNGFGGDRDRRVDWGGPAAGARRPPDAAGRPEGAAGPGPDRRRAAGDAGRRRPVRRGGRGASAHRRDGHDPRGGTARAGARRRTARPGTVERRYAAGAAERGRGTEQPRTGSDAPGPLRHRHNTRSRHRHSKHRHNMRSHSDHSRHRRCRLPLPAPAPAPAPVPQEVRQGPVQAPAQVPTPSPAPAPPAALHTPLTPGPGGGSASWAQQVHQLAQPEPQQHQRQPHQFQHQGPGADQPVVPWKPPVDDPFQQLARNQASARPAGLGKRFAARLVDSIVLGAAVGAAAVPLATRALDHIDRKITAAKETGETVTVWLLDSTTGALLGALLAAFLLIGFLLEALPTAKWGRTLGKKLCGLDVRDIESHDAPTLGAALRRWLVYGVLGLLVIGVVNVLWCLIDRPWRQCWHDKAARTFVAG